MLNEVSQFCQNYYNELPAGALKAVLQSTAFSFTASTILVACTTKLNQPADLSRVLVSSLIGSVASAIHALTIPFFNHIFDHPNNKFNGVKEVIKTLVNIAMTEMLINKMTALNINVISTDIPIGKNFYLFPSNLIKSAASISMGICAWINPAMQHCRMPFPLDFDFNVNPTPFYFAF